MDRLDPKHPFKVGFASELMKNQVPATVVTPNQAMASVQDLAGEPMLFSIGNDGVLNVAMRSAQNRSGWLAYHLTDTFGKEQKAVAFAVGQLPNGQITLAVVMAPASPGEVKKTSLHLAGPFINDATITDWGSVGNAWEERKHPDGDVVITGIRIGAGTEQKARVDGLEPQFPIGIASIRGPDGPEKQWMFNADARDKKWSWVLFDLPEDATGHVMLAAGVVMGVRGAYALYDTSAGQSLEFRGLPDEIYHKSLH